MLRNNLSTRPFYNVRAVQAALAVLAILVVAVTLFNVAQALRLSSRQATLGARAGEAEAEAAKLRGDAARILAQIDPDELEAVSADAREANGIIDQRTFSWTELLTQFESTLPADVRITAIQPQLEEGNRFLITMTAQARMVEDLDAFIEALEREGSFRNVLPTEERTNDEGLIEATVEGEYEAPAPEPEPEPAPEAGVAGE